MERTKKIADLNDQLRIEGKHGQVYMTRGIAHLREDTRLEIISAVRLFNNFTEDNDPYKERDFGAVTVQGQKVFWKIDYYDNCLTAGSEDPADESITTRIMTIMLAEEY